jgi:hypothetical protein
VNFNSDVGIMREKGFYFKFRLSSSDLEYSTVHVLIKRPVSTLGQLFICNLLQTIRTFLIKIKKIV